ncbi:MAG TPA: glycosyltransferase family 4 protein [Tepidisphaeraceae bacterium]|nr:glycosyltransferase family 4 protein [Tepidisphaeraceae bacterium]
MDLASETGKPAIAIISNSHTPYRLHLHQRIAREIPQVRLWSLYTHEISNAPWQFTGGQDIGAVSFGKGEGIDHQDDPRHALREWRRGGKIIGWMREHCIRFVLMMGYNDPGRLRILRWCRRTGTPCWLFGDSNILGDRVSGLKAVIKKQIVGRVVRGCDGVFSCGRLGKEYFVKYGAEASRCQYFPYEPDYDLIAQLDPATIEQTRRRFEVDLARRRIVYSGRLVPVKRCDLLIDAFAAIAAQRPQWDLIVIGDGALREKLQMQAPAELTGRIRWTGFMDDQAAISALYRLSDVLVLPSDYEPWALVVNEACAAGMAVVASTVVGAAAELVRDGINGRIFPAGDGAALAKCLLEVTDPATIDGMKAASAPVLADWRRVGDPVQGLRNALSASGVVRF